MNNKLVSATSNKVEISKMDGRVVSCLGTMIKILLSDEIENGNVEFLTCAYDFLGLHDNKRIIEVSKRNCKAKLSLKQNVMEDIAEIIKDEVVLNHNDGLLELLIGHYMKKYPSAGYEADKYDTLTEFVMAHAVKDSNAHMFALLCYLVSGRVSAVELEYLEVSAIQLEHLEVSKGNTRTKNHLSKEKMALSQMLGADLDESSLYQEILETKKEEVCAYLKIDTEKFEEYILDLFSGKKDVTSKHERVCEMIKYVYGLVWGEHMDAENTFRGNETDMIQAVDRVFETVCMELLTYEVIQCIKEGNKPEISQIDRLVKIEDMEVFFCIFFSAMFYELSTVRIESAVNEYYEDFSFDREDELLMQIDTLKRQHKDKTDKMQSELDGQLVCINKLKAESRQKIEEQTAGYKKEISNLKKQLDDLEHSMEDEKTQVQSRDEFIKMLSACEDDAVKDYTEIDMQKLKTKRYLFVGSAVNEAMPYLKKDFPKSVFINNENYNLKKIKADRAVVFTNYISHEMFHKIKNGLKDMPVIWCNSKNKDIVYRKMQKAV